MSDESGRIRDKKRRKPGPMPDRLKIEEDPQEALRKLLTKPPPDESESEAEEGQGEDDEH